MSKELSELFKKITKRPLLIPSVVIFVCLIVYFNFFENEFVDNSSSSSQIIKIVEVSQKLNGKNFYIGVIDGKRYKIDFESDLYPNDVLLVKGYFKTIDEPSNPGEFNYKKYLVSKGVKGEYKIEDVVDSKESEFGRFITKLRYFIRNEIYALLEQSVDMNHISLISAFCLGDSSLISDDVIKSFNKLNCSHLLAVSGSHFSSFIITIPFIFNMTKLSKKSKHAIYLVIVVLIGFMTGWSESVTRAAIMSMTGILFRDSLSGMSLAALIMMIGNPYSVLSNGFQMSFVSCLAILIFSSKMTEFCFKFFRNSFLSNAISVSICAQGGLLILSSSNDLRIGPFQFFAQLLGGVLLEIICVFFVFGLIFSLVSRLSFMPVIFIIDLMIYSMRKLSQYFYYSIIPSRIGFLFVLCILLVLICLKFYKSSFVRDRKRLIAFVIATMFFISLFSYNSRKPETKIIFIDVGQGDSCLILTERFNCIVDAGIGGNGISTIPDVLDYYQIPKIDFAIMTHWDEDHGGGIIELLKRGRLDAIYTSFVGNNSKVVEFLSNYFSHTEINDVLSKCFKKLEYGQKIYLSDNDVMEVLWPNTICENGDNQDSLVLKLSSFQFQALFTGDIDFDCEKTLCDCGIVGDVDLLKVAHHGSKYSTSKQFLEIITPELAVISVGEHNFYGHPSKDVLERLGEVGANIYKTSKNGAIIVNIFKNKYVVDSFKENRNAF